MTSCDSEHFLRGKSVSVTQLTKTRKAYGAARARRLAHKEKVLLERQCAGKLSKEYSVMKNVSTHSMINSADGELELKLELDDVGVFPSKNHVDYCNVSHAEKMTQTDVDLLSRGSRIGRGQTPNGTSPCNHPSLTCQVCHSLRFVLSYRNAAHASSETSTI